MSWSRRGWIAGGAVAVLGITGLRATNLFGKHYRPTLYDDLIARLGDREAGTRVGRAVLHGQPRFDIVRTAAQLRGALGAGDIANLARADIAAGRMAEADGWVLPQSLAMLCALTAEA